MGDMSEIQFGAFYDGIDMQNRIGPVEFAEQAEAWGYDCFWVPEVLTMPHMDPLVILAAAASRTQQIGLGTGVVIIPVRSPFQLAKASTSIDVLSKGRFILGVGNGGLFPKDFEVEGVDIHRRGKIADEKLDVLRRLLSETNVSYQGKYHQFRDITVEPRSVQKPHIPVWVGASWNDGMAEGVLRRTARYGDGFFSHDTPVEGYKEAQNRIKEYVVSYGRDPHEIEWAYILRTCLGDSKVQALNMANNMMKTHYAPLKDVRPENGYALGTPTDCIEVIQQYIDLGITHIVLYPIGSSGQLLGQFEVLAKEVIPHFSYKIEKGPATGA